MRISFDVDDTIICYDPSVPTEQLLPWLLRPWFTEPLRQGTRALMRDLICRGCEIWIYTTSYRNPLYLKLWFRAMGVRLGGVVNQDIHDRIVKKMTFCSYWPSKYPPAFGIDLHIDDSEGVGIEGKQLGFDVIVVSPSDNAWASHVMEEIQSRKKI